MSKVSKLNQKELEQLYAVLKEQRELQELTQAEVAESLGVTVSTYADLERGRSNASLLRFTDALRVLGLRLKIVKKS